MSRFPLLIALTLTVVLAAPAQTRQELRDSLEWLNRQIDLHPRSTDLRLRKAALNLELEQWEYAIDECARVLQLDADNLAAFYYRAYANVHRRQLGLARSDYEQLLARQPRHMEARLGLAHVLELMSLHNAALDQYSTLVELYPDSALCYAGRASCEVKLNQFEAALFDWEQAVVRSPDRLDYVVSEVSVLLRLGRKRSARAELDDAVARGLATRNELHEWYVRCR